MKLCDVSVSAAGRFYQRGHESAKGEGLNTIEIMAPNRGMKRRPFARIAYDVKIDFRHFIWYNHTVNSTEDKKRSDAMIEAEMLPQVGTGQIPGLNKRVSRLFFGTANPPISTDDAAAFALLDSVLEMGINAFDCARSYGLAEHTLGKWMEARKNRDQAVVLSKCGDVRNGQVRINRQVIDDQLRQSLDALRTDHIDIYLLHRHDPDTPEEAMIDALNAHWESGRIGVFGVSNWTHQQIEKANRYASAHGLRGFSVSSPNYGLARQLQDPYGGECVTISGPENTAARDWYGEHQIPVIAYSSLGRGFFSGRFKAYDYDAARQTLDRFAQKGYLYDENMLRLQRAEALAQRDGVTVPEIAMRYAFSSAMNLFAVVSTASAERMGMNIRASVNPLPPEDVAFLEANQ